MATNNLYQQRLNRNLSLYKLSGFFSGFLLVIPIWVSFSRRFLTFPQMMLLESIAMSFTVALELPTGALSDLIGRRYSVSLGWLLNAVGGFIMAFSFDGLSLSVGFILAAIGDAFNRVVVK